ncbi:hypothetical protein L1987_33068 [Smallanthus sonchifolius]|uniref:Uncharacterized protein n=1 Tax=Smallanthus sonchifolius TaxID=185202 RepID=A0ACB9HQ15_9ASTR|nr:hypothetical protein L1987_33068 [Smallanthus sonchifolius]
MFTALTKDPNNHVKDTAAWTLGRILEFLHGSIMKTPIITSANCQQIITVLLQSMKDAPNLAEKSCGGLYFLAQVTHREDAGESRLRTAAYETLNEVVRCSTDETVPMVLHIVPIIMMELHKTLEEQKLSSDEKESVFCRGIFGCYFWRESERYRPLCFCTGERLSWSGT